MKDRTLSQMEIDPKLIEMRKVRHERALALYEQMRPVTQEQLNWLAMQQAAANPGMYAGIGQPRPTFLDSLMGNLFGL